MTGFLSGGITEIFPVRVYNNSFQCTIRIVVHFHTIRYTFFFELSHHAIKNTTDRRLISVDTLPITIRIDFNRQSVPFVNVTWDIIIYHDISTFHLKKIAERERALCFGITSSN